jgi:hypothetical protein
METKTIYLTILYITLVCFFGYIIGCYFANTNVIREGARTYPRHVINPITKEDILDIKPLPPYYGETLNQFIDKIIAQYFDKRGYPYTNTIEKYSDLCIENAAGEKLGVTTETNKRKLTDIGFYILNIVIPNVQMVDNPRPNVAWPAIQWTDDPTFKTQVQPTSTYRIYKGQAWSSYSNEMDADTTTGANNDSNNDSSSSSSSSSSSDDNGGEDPSATSPLCGLYEDNSDCRLTCPSNCVAGALNAWEEVDKMKKEKEDAEKENNGVSTDASTVENTYPSNSTKYPGVASLKKGSNVLIIGDATLDGYQTTDVDVDKNITLLNENVNTFINDYFIESGPNQGKPTQKAIDDFELYFNQNKTPMDGIHMNKMRDLVYYILQSIIPGLPTAQLPRAYVEWRPIHWLSRSEPK